MTEAGAIKGALKRILLRLRGISWLKPIRGRVLRLPVVGGVLRLFLQSMLPRGSRIWFRIPTGPARGLWLKLEPYLEDRYFSGFPEPGVQEEIVKHLYPGSCFYDAGAHIGYYSLVAARLVGKTGRVVAFERDPDNVKMLQENMARNGISNIDVISAALWSTCGTVTFQRSSFEAPETSSRRGAVIAPNVEGLALGQIEVEAVTLDAVMANHEPPALVKVDVEGAEGEVLKGARDLISRTRPIFLFEVHHQEAATFLQDQLRQTGYQFEWLPAHPGFAFPRHLLARADQRAREGWV